MVRNILVALTTVGALAIFGGGIDSAQAGTIKLSMGNDPMPDVQFNGTFLSTIVDEFALTPGLQNTAIEFIDFPIAIPPVSVTDGSFTLQQVAIDGFAQVVDVSIIPPVSVFVQAFSDGSFSLFDGEDLLLSATLDDSAVTGPLGGAAAGAFFTTTLAQVTGGTLATEFGLQEVSLSIAMTNVNANLGFSISGDEGEEVLNTFSADATATISVMVPIPEPATAALALLGCVLAAPWALGRQGRSRGSGTRAETAGC